MLASGCDFYKEYETNVYMSNDLLEYRNNCQKRLWKLMLMCVYHKITSNLLDFFKDLQKHTPMCAHIHVEAET